MKTFSRVKTFTGFAWVMGAFAIVLIFVLSTAEPQRSLPFVTAVIGLFLAFIAGMSSAISAREARTQTLLTVSGQLHRLASRMSSPRARRIPISEAEAMEIAREAMLSIHIAMGAQWTSEEIKDRVNTLLFERDSAKRFEITQQIVRDME